MKVRKAAGIVAIALLLLVTVPGALGYMLLQGDGGNREDLPAAAMPPPKLSSLPAEAQSRCYDAWKGRDVRVFLWELPGVEPADRNSAYQGNRGMQLGFVPACTAVTVEDYAWSRFDRRFWVYIRTPNGKEGWVELDMVDFQQLQE